MFLIVNACGFDESEGFGVESVFAMRVVREYYLYHWMQPTSLTSRGAVSERIEAVLIACSCDVMIRSYTRHGPARRFSVRTIAMNNSGQAAEYESMLILVSKSCHRGTQ